ncbi:MAG: response regulator transcription factor [bacterium]|nr:response regulator transcription factor [bacterium]
MKALIADDEPIARRTLGELLEDQPEVEVVGEAATGEETLEQIRKLRPEVVFLDLHMPELDGFGVVRSLRGETLPLVIYVTAYSEHALEAFDTGAVDYLLKPGRPERLETAIGKARAQLAGARPATGAAAPGPGQKIVGKRGSDLHLFDPAEVIAFEADGEVVHVRTAKGRYYASHTLKELEQRLPSPPFRRVHRKTIINSDHIRRISPLSSKRWLLTMSNGMEVVVSKRMTGALRKATEY